MPIIPDEEIISIMKPFNIFLIVSLIIIFSGFLFFKDSLNQITSKQTAVSSSNVLMDRLSYLDYSNQNLTIAKRNGKTTLFFAATTWCQTCSALDKEINGRIRDIPSDITILKVDYDNDKEMRNKYDVTTQHTLVVLDNDGNELKRWIGGNFDLLLQEVKEN